jgi:splicing factor 3B subunit 3
LQTETDDVPTALLAFQGRLVAGVGKALRIYDLGKKKLLRKAENKVGS